MAKSYGKNDISNVVDKVVFFDANILIYLFWSSGRSYQENGYASIYSALIKQKNQPAVDFIVISEVINRMIRTECSRLGYKFDKEFRNSDIGKNMICDVYEIVHSRIINNFKVVGKVYGMADIKNFLTINNLDFSDKAIVNICQENNYVLLTDDSDFANIDIEIISLNNKLLNSNSRKIRL